MIVEVLRGATSLVWLVILILFFRSMWRAARGVQGLRAIDAVMGATWLLALNRQAFAAVSQFDPGDDDALALCYIMALVAGLLMVGAGLWGRREPR
jgi:hypothetical protein